MEFGLLSEAEARSPALSLSDAGTPHPPLPEHGCKGQGSRPKLLDQLFRRGLWRAAFKSEFQLGGSARSIPLDMLISVTPFSGLVINNNGGSRSVLSDSLQSHGL